MDVLRVGSFAEILNGPLHFLQDPLFNMGRLGFVGQRGGD
jgi:hypothetical protein